MIETLVGNFNLPKITYQRSLLPKQQFESLRQVLSRYKGFYDFTAHKKATAILYYSEELIILI